MPRAFDRYIPDNDHDPLRALLDFDNPLGTLGDSLETILEAIRNGLTQLIQELTGLDFSDPAAFLTSLIELITTGGPLVGFIASILGEIGSYIGIPNLGDFLTGLAGLNPLEILPKLLGAFQGINLDGGPGAVLQAITQGIGQLIGNLLNGGQPINAINLFGTLLPGLFSNIPIGALNSEQPNQWSQGEFPSADSIADNPVWSWDASVGRAAAGSARVTANGLLKVLRRAPIPVAPGQKIDMHAWARWSGLTYTGTPIRLGVRTFEAGSEPNSWDLLDSIDLDSIASPGANSSSHPDADDDDFVELSAVWTVPAGVEAYTPRLIVTGDATAGTVWFDDGSGKQTGLIQQAWVSDLVADLQALLDWVENLVDQLLDALGLDVLGNLADKIFDLADEVSGWFGDTQGVIGNVSSLFSTVLDRLADLDILDVPDGSLFDAIGDALANIPFLNILGFGGPADIGGSFQETWDQLIGGFVGAVGSGSGLSDLFNIAQEVSSNAFKGFLSLDILGIRNNKGFGSGMLSSSTASIPLTQVAVGGSAPTFGVTSTTAITLYERVQESAECGVVRWMGSGTTNITGFFLNIYKMDPSTGDRTCVYTSGDIKADLSATMTTNKHVMSTPIQREPSEIYGYELALTGTGTHTVVGQSSWIHADPDVYPRKMSSVRSGGSVSVSTMQSSGSITYGSNIPFIEIAVGLDDVVIPHSPETVLFNTVQSGTSLPIPSWANFVEAIPLGGGGGGRQGGTWGVSGEGGENGNWNTDTWERGVDWAAAESVSLSITVAAGGAGGTGIGANGGTSSVTLPASTGHSAQTLNATGGEGGDALNAGGGDKQGQSPGNITYGGVIYQGGAAQNTFGGNGSAPGGGGAGGNYVSFQHGGDGARGAVWIRFKQ